MMPVPVMAAKTPGRAPNNRYHFAVGMLGVAVLFLAGLWPVDVSATQTPLSAPPRSLFSALGDALQTPLDEPRWRCSAEPEQTCGCVRLTSGEWNFLFTDFESTSEGLRAERVVGHSQRGTFEARQMAATPSDDTAVITTEQWSWSPDDSTLYTLHAERLHLEARDPPSVEIEHPVWSDASSPSPPDTCSDVPGIEATTSPEDPQATAARLVLRDDGWSIEELETDPGLSLPVSTSRGATEPSTGFFPPTAYLHPGGLRLSGAYYLGEPPLSLRAHTDTPLAGGLGVGIWSTSPTCAQQGCGRQPAAVDVFFDDGGFATVRAVGTASIGEPRLHASMDLDGIGVVRGTYSPDRTDRLARGALFRDWRAQRVGVSASGSNHQLAIGGAVLSGEPGVVDLRDNGERFADLWLHYGTDFELGRQLEAKFGLEHREIAATEVARSRYTEAGVRLQRVFGSKKRAFVRPALQGRTAMATSREDPGIAAGSRIRLDAMIDGGLAIRGRLAGMDHRIRPRGFVGRRFVPVDGLPAVVETIRTGMEAASIPRGHFFVGAGVEQRLAVGPARQIRVPTSISVVDDGTGTEWTPRAAASLEFRDLSTSHPVAAAADLVCVADCESWGLRGRLQVGLGDRFELVHIIGRTASLRPGVPGVLQAVRSGYLDDFGLLYNRDAPGGVLAHASAIRGEWSNWTGELGIFGDATTPEMTGAEVSIGPHWPALGWGVALRAAAQPADGRWAAMVGMRTEP